jgi:hypothetical protein
VISNDWYSLTCFYLCHCKKYITLQVQFQLFQLPPVLPVLPEQVQPQQELLREQEPLLVRP